MHHPNEQVLRDIDEAQVSKQAFLEVFSKFNEVVPDYQFEGHAYLADDEHGVSLQSSTYKRGDEIIESNDAFVSHFRDGKVSEFWLLSTNEAEVDAFLG